MDQNRFKTDILPLRNMLLRKAYRILVDSAEAEDIVQETLMKLWVQRHELEQYHNVAGFSVHMTKNLCLNRLKRKKRMSRGSDEYALVAIDYSTPHDQLEQKDSMEQVMKIMDGLPGLQQAVLRMKHIEGLEVEEIAALTGSSVEAIRMNLSRARRKVKELFMKIEEL